MKEKETKREHDSKSQDDNWQSIGEAAARLMEKLKTERKAA